MKKVSVIIPVYNVEHYLARCLDSVLNQSYRDIEIVMVDDACTDGSLVIAEQYQKKYSDIIIVRHEKNQGLMMTRRDGYQVASGDLVMFLDSDDALPKYAVEKLVNKQVETNADIVMGDLLKYYVDGTTERRIGSLPYPVTKLDVLSSLLEKKIVHSLCGKLYKKSLLQKGKLQIFDSMTIAEDACLIYQLVVNAEKIASLDAIVYDYYENKVSSTQHVYGDRQIENIIVAHRVIGQVCAPYSMLGEKVQHCLTKAIFTLYFERVSVWKVRSLLRKYGMLSYGNVKYAYKYLRPEDYSFFIKRYIYVRVKLQTT